MGFTHLIDSSWIINGVLVGLIVAVILFAVSRLSKSFEKDTVVVFDEAFHKFALEEKIKADRRLQRQLQGLHRALRKALFSPKEIIRVNNQIKEAQKSIAGILKNRQGALHGLVCRATHGPIPRPSNFPPTQKDEEEMDKTKTIEEFWSEIKEDFASGKVILNRYVNIGLCRFGKIGGILHSATVHFTFADYPNFQMHLSGSWVGNDLRPFQTGKNTITLNAFEWEDGEIKEGSEQDPIELPLTEKFGYVLEFTTLIRRADFDCIDAEGFAEALFQHKSRSFTGHNSRLWKERDSLKVRTATLKNLCMKGNAQCALFDFGGDKGCEIIELPEKTAIDVDEQDYLLGTVGASKKALFWVPIPEGECPENIRVTGTPYPVFWKESAGKNVGASTIEPTVPTNREEFVKWAKNGHGSVAPTIVVFSEHGALPVSIHATSLLSSILVSSMSAHCHPQRRAIFYINALGVPKSNSPVFFFAGPQESKEESEESTVQSTAPTPPGTVTVKVNRDKVEYTQADALGNAQPLRTLTYIEECDGESDLLDVGDLLGIGPIKDLSMVRLHKSEEGYTLKLKKGGLDSDRKLQVCNEATDVVSVFYRDDMEKLRDCQCTEDSLNELLREKISEWWEHAKESINTHDNVGHHSLGVNPSTSPPLRGKSDHTAFFDEANFVAVNTVKTVLPIAYIEDVKSWLVWSIGEESRRDLLVLGEENNAMNATLGEKSLVVGRAYDFTFQSRPGKPDAFTKIEPSRLEFSKCSRLPLQERQTLSGLSLGENIRTQEEWCKQYVKEAFGIAEGQLTEVKARIEGFREHLIPGGQGKTSLTMTLRTSDYDDFSGFSAFVHPIRKKILTHDLETCGRERTVLLWTTEYSSFFVEFGEKYSSTCFGRIRELASNGSHQEYSEFMVSYPDSSATLLTVWNEQKSLLALCRGFSRFEDKVKVEHSNGEIFRINLASE